MPKKTVDISINGTFRFCGDGEGIPGLPHEVTVRQAEEIGLLDVLQAAIKNGNYKAVIAAGAIPSEEGKE